MTRTKIQTSSLSFSDGPVLIGSATSTGTALQTLQVTGGAYVSGNLGIGNINPEGRIHARADGDEPKSLIVLQNRNAGGAAGCAINFMNGTLDLYDNRYAYIRSIVTDAGQNGNHLVFGTNANGSAPIERVRLDSSGRLLVGTTSARANYYGSITPPGIQNEQGYGTFFVNANTAGGPAIYMGKSRGTTANANTVVASGDELGSIIFFGADGTNPHPGAQISAQVDGTTGINSMPGRLVFYTTATGQNGGTERMRIDSKGFAKFSNTGSYAAVDCHQHRADTNETNTFIHSTNATYTSNVLQVRTSKAGNSNFVLAYFASNDGADVEFNLRGDGNAFADGTWAGGGADYAEYFEWSDSNPAEEDRRGISVVLDGNKIREALPGEDPIGVISGNPSVVGDAAWNKWSGKYLRDEYGTYIQEDYEVEDGDGNTVIQQRRKLNPAYDPDVEYISRENRPEWDCVGLMGKLRIRKGQVTGSRWIKMRDINASIEEWLVR